jgi:hypothetical protein
MADDTPNVTVIDEVPWPVEQDREFEGALQTVWDRHLSSKPVLFLLVGSDVSVMEGLLSYGRPFFSRAARLTARPLNLADVQAMTDSSVGEAVDAHLPTRASRRSRSHGGNERASAANPLSPLLVAGDCPSWASSPKRHPPGPYWKRSAVGNGCSAQSRPGHDALVPGHACCPRHPTCRGLTRRGHRRSASNRPLGGRRISYGLALTSLPS